MNEIPVTVRRGPRPPPAPRDICSTPGCGRPRNKHRGLCRRCYDALQNKSSAPGHFAALADTDAGFARPLPTAALPGSPEKIAELCRRSGRHELLFCPDDALLGDDDYAGNYDTPATAAYAARLVRIDALIAAGSEAARG
jgi:hypothetical protein